MGVTLEENGIALVMALNNRIQSTLCEPIEYAKAVVAQFTHADVKSHSDLTDSLRAERLLSYQATPAPEATHLYGFFGRDVGLVSKHSSLLAKHVSWPSGDTAGHWENPAISSHAAGEKLLAFGAESLETGSESMKATNIGSFEVEGSPEMRNHCETQTHPSSLSTFFELYQARSDIPTAELDSPEPTDSSVQSGINEVGPTPIGNLKDAGNASGDTSSISSDTLPICQHSKRSLSALPPELHRLIVSELDDVSKTCLKFTNSYFHASIKNRCARLLGPKWRHDLLARLGRDVLPHRALVQCPCCEDFRLREILRGPSFGRRWMLKRLSWSEERRSCCKTLVPSSSTALPMTQLGASTRELQSAEIRLNMDDPGIALILVCLHCSAELPWRGENAVDMGCPRCRCKACPLVFMPRHLSLSLADA